MVLQCNGGLDLSSNETLHTRSHGDYTNCTTAAPSNSTTYTANKLGIYLYIIGSVAGVLLLSTLIIVAVVVVCRRRKKQLKKNPAKVTYSSTSPGLSHDANGYCVIDTNRKMEDNATSQSQSKKPKWLTWRQTKASNATTEEDEPTRLNKKARKDRVTPLSMQPPVLSTAPVAESTKGLTNKGFSYDGEDKKVLHILAPDPDAPEEKDIVFVHVPRGARPAKVQQSGNLSCDPDPRERSVHLYSDVEDIDGASGGEAKTGPSDINPLQSLQNPKSQIAGSNQRKEYEEVMASDLRSSPNSKAGVPQRDKSNEYQDIMAGDVQPSHNPETRIPSQDKSNEYQENMAVGEPSKVYHILEPDPDALPENDIVIVSVTGAVHSTGDYMHKRVEEASGKNLEDDDDELVMIDNILYNSGNPKSQTQPQHEVTGAVHSTRDYMHKGVEEEDADDELVMIDNILYKSSDPESQTQHQHKAPYPQPPTATNPTHSESNIPDDNNLHLYSEVDDSLIVSRENPNTPLPLQNDHILNDASSTGESVYHHYADIDESVIASAEDSKTRPANNSGKKSNTGQYEEIELTP